MNQRSAADEQEELGVELLNVYEVYIDSFNRGDIDACVDNIVISYHDLHAIDAQPTQTILATRDESRRSSVDVHNQMLAAG